MKQFGLYVDALPTNEASLLRSIVRLSSDLGGRWRICDRVGESDVEVVDLDRHPEVVPETPRLPLVTSRAWRDERKGAFLPRPFRADSLFAALGILEAKLKSLSASAASQRARLLRWPVGHVPGKDPSAMRMATVLSRMPCSAQDLAGRVGLPRETCEHFLRALDQDGYLAWEAPAAAPAGEPTATASTSSRFGGGLIAALRRKLGLS